MRRWIEKSLYWYPRIYSCRFDVLANIFCTLGTGIELRNGYLWEYEVEPKVSPEEDVDGLKFIQKEEKLLRRYYEMEVSVRELIAGLSDTEQQYQIPTMEVEIKEWLDKARNYRIAYHTLPEKVYLYPWSEDERFQPFRKFIGCKNEGFEEQVEYFLTVLANTPEENVFSTTSTEYTAKYRENFHVWQSKTDLIKEVLL